MTLVFHVYIFPENSNTVVERKTKMLHEKCKSVNALASHRCDPGSIAGVSM